MVLHYSTNWMMDGLATFEFDTVQQCEKYIRDFQSKNKEHGNDHVRIVENLKAYEGTEVDHGLYGFKTNK
jgi:hypothetical protein